MQRAVAPLRVAPLWRVTRRRLPISHALDESPISNPRRLSPAPGAATWAPALLAKDATARSPGRKEVTRQRQPRTEGAGSGKWHRHPQPQVPIPSASVCRGEGFYTYEDFVYKDSL